MLYLAPLEGITGYIYRNAYQKYFGGIDRYFTPFIAPAKGKPFRHRELADVRPEHNTGIMVIPQILTNHSEGFIKAAKALVDMGYDEININMGCPSVRLFQKEKVQECWQIPQSWIISLRRYLQPISAKYR